MRAHKLAATLLALLLLTLASASCSPGAVEPGISKIDWEDPELRAEQFVTALVNGDFRVAAEGFDSAMKRALSVSALRRAWESTVTQAGSYISLERTEIIPHEEYSIYLVTTRHEIMGVSTRIVFDTDGLVAGLFFSYVPNYDEWDLTPIAREGFTDIPIIVGEGTDFPLRGFISMPDSVSGGVPAVILVHGSGPQNMDLEAFGITVFKDIAEHLAHNGIAVLRYDKRTYAHGARFAVQYGDDFTVWEETIEDALLAKAVLEQVERVDQDRIYVLGLSLGGMLAPRIADAGGFAGAIIMAGSPRSLMDIILDQNKYFIELNPISASERISLYAQVDAARKQFFGMPEKYILEMDAHPPESFLAATDKPFLIMQGMKDFQVYADVDFELYKEIARGRSNFEFRLYDNLNHLFTLSTMEKPTLDDYVAGSKVDPAPLNDIVKWVNER